MTQHGRWPAAGAALRRHRRWLLPFVVVALLGQMAYAMLATAVAQTPTIDEPVYVGTAVVYLRDHDLRYNPEHPPLGKLAIAVGLAFADPRLDSTDAPDQSELDQSELDQSELDQSELGRNLLYRSGNDAQRLMLFARLPVIILTLLFGLVVFLFARDLVGSVGSGGLGGLGGLGGVAALALYAFSPDVIAHGSLATLDVPAAGFLLTAGWLLWRARLRPALYLPLAGLALGAAVATKASALPAVPVLLLLAVLSVWYATRRRDPAPAEDDPAKPAERGEPAESAGSGSSAVARLGLGVAAAAGVGVLAVVVVWAAYLAVDPRLRWAAPPGVPDLGGLRGLAVDLLPFPEPFRDGLRIQYALEDERYSGYLLGRRYRGSLWYYLPVAMLVKTPLGMLALWVAGSLAMLAVPRLRPAVLYVLVPPAVLSAAAVTSSRDLGVRYAIVVPLFLAVGAAAVLAVRRRWVHAVAAVLVLFVAVSSMRAFPYYLPYSNEAFGGPAQTYRHLHDSNVDWGQDLGRLADRLRERYPGEPVWLVYKGSGVPSYYGIRAGNPLRVPPEEVRGLLVVSNSRVVRATGRLKALIGSSERIDQVGHSITIYRREPAPLTR
jgi:hypothetical protein